MNRLVIGDSTLRFGFVWTRNFARALFQQSNCPLLMLSAPIILGIGAFVASIALYRRVQVQTASEREQQHEEDNYQLQLEALIRDGLRVRISPEDRLYIEYYVTGADRRGGRAQAELDQETEIEHHAIEATPRLEYINSSIPSHRSVQASPLLPREDRSNDDGNDQYNEEGNDESNNEDGLSPQRGSVVLQYISFVDPDNEDCLITVRGTSIMENLYF